MFGIRSCAVFLSITCTYFASSLVLPNLKNMVLELMFRGPVFSKVQLTTRVSPVPTRGSVGMTTGKYGNYKLMKISAIYVHMKYWL